MNKTVDVVFLIEHLDREGEVVKRISAFLEAKYGLSSCALSISFHSHILRHVSAKVFVLPYALSSNDWPLQTLTQVKVNGAQIVNLNWEQLFSASNADYKRPRDEFIKNELKHSSWSESFSNYLTENGVDPANIRINGNPLHQLLREAVGEGEAHRSALAKSFNLSRSKEWIFLPMNYGWAFSSDKVIQKKIANGYDEEVAWKYRTYSKRCLGHFVRFLKELSDDSNCEIIVRPHPSISVEQYESVICAEIGSVPQNTMITKEYSILEWVAASQIIGSSWSTTVWDAFNVGKRVFLYTPEERPDWLDVWWNHKVPNIKSIEGFKEVRAKSGSTSHKNEIELCANWLSELASEVVKAVNISKSASVKETLYFGRSWWRSFLMSKFGGRYIDGGLIRDYFDAGRL